MASLLDDTATSPTAVFTANNLMTIGAMRLLRERGVSIPAQMSLVGFDDLDLSELLDPPPTVIDRATFALGSSAAEMLRARLAAPDRAQQHLILPVELIVRGSTSSPPPRRPARRPSPRPSSR
jgi:LacI family transcriptional regulator